MTKPAAYKERIRLTATRAGVEDAVLRRYATAAERVEPALCCPAAEYDREILSLLPDEIVEKDYGCGDPTRHVGEGETVVDLGSGAGKICYMLSKKVGAGGAVIGVDFNDAMLDVARRHQDEMATRIGYSNVRFVKARIQDMALDLDALDRWLTDHPVRSVGDLESLDAERERLRAEHPGVAGASVDVVVSNCVLNLVRTEEKADLFREIHRVLKPGGRAVISDIVCDERPTDAILTDPDLWSGCIAGAFREDEFLERFEAAGFYGVEILDRAEQPWQVLDGVEFRSLTVRAYKGKEGPCLDRNQAVVYKGPWKRVVDDDGHTLHRGKRMAVCDKTFRLMTDPRGPYSGRVAAIAPREDVAVEDALPFECGGVRFRDPRETKGRAYAEMRASSEGACGDGSCC